MSLYCKCGKEIDEKLHNSYLISNFEPSMCFDCLKSYYNEIEENNKYELKLLYSNDNKFLEKLKGLKNSYMRLKIYE